MSGITLEGGSTYVCKCTGCGTMMGDLEFNDHDCPATPKQHSDESDADYLKRLEALL